MPEMPLRRGAHHPLEEAANAIIKESLRGVTSHRAKSDVLTPWKEAERHRREVYVTSGVPDPSVRSGIFYRSTNSDRPDLNSREGAASHGRGMTFRGLRNFLLDNANFGADAEAADET